MRRLTKWALLVGAAVLLLGLLAVGVFELTALIVERSLPDVADVSRFDREIWKVTRVYSEDGVELAEFYKERRTIVPYSRVSPHMVKALLAAEDDGFFEHGGVDWLAVARAVVVDVLSGAMVQGGSTLTQQLAKNLYVGRKRSLTRKVREALMARKIERSIPKEAILHQYFNLIYWGHGNYGVEEAARFYFGKGADEVDMGEAALLAGIIRGPENLSPLKRPEKARERMERVLLQMQRDGALPPGPMSVPFPRLSGRRSVRPELSPFGVDAALVEFHRTVERGDLDIAGYRLETTVDSSLQEAVNEGVAAYLPQLGLSFQSRGDAPESLSECLDGESLLPGCPVWVKVLKGALPGKDGRTDGVLADLAGRLATIPADSLRLPDGEELVPAPGTWMRVLSTREVALASPWLTEETTVVPLVKPQVAVVLLEAATGRIKALYGGVDHRYHPFNRALTARRPIGSTIKPFIYLAAMEELGLEEDSLVDASPLTLTGPQGRAWVIRDLHERGTRIPVHEALAWSSNCAAVRVLRTLGTDLFLERWRAWGMPEPDVTDQSLALGSMSMSPLELASIYAVLAGSPCRPEPSVLAGATRFDGKRIALPAAACAGNPPTDLARRVRRMLLGVTEEGTGKAAAIEGMQIPGKTGTSAGGRDAWFAGIIGGLVLVVWIGSDDFEPIEGNSGPETAARLWREVAQRIGWGGTY
jgi:penicillin-binding protein 1A